MNEQQVRQIIKEELLKQNYNSGAPIVPPHTHDGISNTKIEQENIIPGVKFNGTINMSQNATYTIPITGNPTQVTFYGGALNTSGGAATAQHVMVVGNAQLGSCYQFQPGTDTSVTLNNIQTTIIQGSAAIGIYSSSLSSTTLQNSQGHICYALDITGAVAAYADIISYDNSSLKITVHLSSNWRISGLWIVT